MGRQRRCTWSCKAWKITKSHDADGPTWVDESICLLGHKIETINTLKNFACFGIPLEECERPTSKRKLKELLGSAPK